MPSPSLTFCPITNTPTIATALPGWSHEASATTLRLVLRERTREAHHRVDAALGALDLATPAGLADFLLTHHLALTHLEPALGAAAEFDVPPSRLPLLEADLAALGHAPARGPAPGAGCGLGERLRDPEPLGLAYVLAGAHFGTRVLQARWARSTEPSVRAAHRFLADTGMRDLWRALLPRLARPAREHDRVERAVAAAHAAFDVHLDAFLRIREARHVPS